ncbi:MAG: hypothetical protein FVQ84_21505 [Planctomycetes bacterium]|nr:hypothetical protein [Planctomycetota bacterium]
MVRFLLSIFSFDTVEYRSLLIPHGALGALLVLVCIESLLHLYEGRLPDPVLWGNTETSAKMLQVKRWSLECDDCFDALVLGPSHARFGISPKAMRTAAGGQELTVYNGALNGRTYPVFEFLLKNVYVSTLKPHTLILAANPLVFNRHNTWMERNTLEFFEAPMPRALSSQGIVKAWRIFLIDNIKLYRYRERQDGLHNGHLGNGVSLDAYGFSSIDGTYDDKARARLQSPKHPYQTIMREFDFGGPSVEAFVRILKYALNMEIRVIVVNMPFRKDLLSISATGEEDYETFLKEMRALQYEYRFMWLDYQASVSLTDEDFRDVDHLNTRGAQQLSARLGEDLARFITVMEEPSPSGVRK